MRHVIVGVVVLAVATAIAWFAWPRDKPAPAAIAENDAALAPRTSAGSAAVDTSRVRKLAPDERRRLGDQIRAAIARSRTASTAVPSTATSGGTAPSLPSEPDIPLEEVSKELFAALKDALPLVAECYKQHGTAKQAMAKMTMISDPELGTVIDTEVITDREGKPIEPKLDECMRDTIDSLGLPPLGKPGKLKVQYTFQMTE